MHCPARSGILHVPRNTPVGVFLAFFAVILGFALIWRIDWLAAVGLVGAVGVALARVLEDRSGETGADGGSCGVRARAWLALSPRRLESCTRSAMSAACSSSGGRIMSAGEQALTGSCLACHSRCGGRRRFASWRASDSGCFCCPTSSSLLLSLRPIRCCRGQRQEDRAPQSCLISGTCSWKPCVCWHPV